MIDYIWDVLVFVFWFQVLSILLPLAVYALGITFVVIVGGIGKILTLFTGGGKPG